MNTDSINLTRLRQLCGKYCRYRGMVCRIVAVVEDGPQLVLQQQQGNTVQPDQFGYARRCTPTLHSVAVLNPRRDGLNPLLVDLPTLLERTTD